jgi:alkylhydroperoxidase family enzyme
MRVPYPDLSKHPDHIRKMVEGNPLNIVRMVSHATPEVFENWYKFGSSFFANSALAKDHLEIGALRAGYIANAPYEYVQHEAIAKSVGLTDAQIAAIKAAGKHPGVLSDAQQAVLDFVDEYILNAKPSDSTLAAVRAHLSDQQLIDLMFVTGFYMTMSRIIETTGVPIDQKLMDMRKMKELADGAFT